MPLWMTSRSTHPVTLGMSVSSGSLVPQSFDAVQTKLEIGWAGHFWGVLWTICARNGVAGWKQEAYILEEHKSRVKEEFPRPIMDRTQGNNGVVAYEGDKPRTVGF